HDLIINLYNPAEPGTASNGLFHCHYNKNALEKRKMEQQKSKIRLYRALAICLVFMIGEIVGGYFASSLAVMTDAAHLLVDFISFLISLFSLWLSSRPVTKKLNFGWYRAEILGALFSVFTIWVVTGVLVAFACKRLISGDYEINGVIMLITSSCAVIANIIMGFALHEGGHGHSHGKSRNERLDESDHSHQPNASVRAAFIHVVGDLFQSISVFISALIIYLKPEYKIADPVCTFIFSLFVLATTITILRDILLVLMEGTPTGLNYTAVKEKILRVKGVETVHGLHLWALTMNQNLLSAHVTIDDALDPQEVLKEITQAVFDSFNFYSITIQVEQYVDSNPECVFCQDPKD
uniref:Proton-coupled zinc antiporter SLC30A8 n=1 Tax=Callorhinchus milii TaxID=7868 RepID=A0A4W3K1I4_CALMI